MKYNFLMFMDEDSFGEFIVKSGLKLSYAKNMELKSADINELFIHLFFI